MKRIILLLILIIVVGCTVENENLISTEFETEELISIDVENEEIVSEAENNNTNPETATFAGGCFWCIEAAYDGLEGVHEAVSGYTGGHTKNPTYKDVLTGKTGHYEAIQVKFNPAVISYKELLKIFWRQIDPTDDGGQFVDRGSQYKTVIFYHDKKQKSLAEESKKELENSKKFDKPIVTQILPFEKFYQAEEYHQDYAKKRALSYKLYEGGSGRPKFKEETWGE
jgi:peptide methionine sulfoxide reductase msrA/msrB